jgi:hypothetical protein
VSSRFQRWCLVILTLVVLFPGQSLSAQEDGGEAPVPECHKGLSDFACQRLEDGSVMLTWSTQGQPELVESIAINGGFAGRAFTTRSSPMSATLLGDATEFHDVDAPPTAALAYSIFLYTHPHECVGDSGPVQASCLLQVPFRRGDQDGDGQADITDALNSLCSLMLGCGIPVCADAQDVDNSGVLDITDPLNLLSAVFFGGYPVPPPGLVHCGLDPVEGDPAGHIPGLPDQSGGLRGLQPVSRGRRPAARRLRSVTRNIE